MIGISIKKTIGIGDAVQFSSLPENYYKSTGSKLIDISKPWFFDYNPYVFRDPDEMPVTITEMWNFPKKWDYPLPRKDKDRPLVYLSNAEIWASLFEVPAVLTRPRFYRYENYPFELRENIYLHTQGISHGQMPQHVIDHVLEKYSCTGKLKIIGLPGCKTYSLPFIETKTLWDLTRVLSEARMLICLDSGPSWIAAAYPDVIIKKVRTKPTVDYFKDWVPLEVKNIHSHWDDRVHQIYNPSETDIGFTWSYKRI